MNKIRAIQALNKKEIEQGISPDASWHTDYRDTAYIYFGGLPYELSEGDVLTIFSQFGEPVFLKLARDKESGKSRGFGWLKYEDQRSTDLAVDNLGGAEFGGRLISVDHARYKARDDEDPDEFRVGWEDMRRKEAQPVSDEESAHEEEERRPQLPEEMELAKLIREHDDDDPMKGFLIEEKKAEVDEARRKAEKRASKDRHRHRRSHRHRRDDGDEPRPKRRHRDESPADRGRRPKDEESRKHRARSCSARGEPRRHRRDDGDDHERELPEDGDEEGGRDRRRRRRDCGDNQGNKRPEDRDVKGEGERRRHAREISDEHQHKRDREDDNYDRRARQRSRDHWPRHGRGE